MIYVFDIDGTLCDTWNDYHNAEPDVAMITLINMLHDQGHVIKIFTARGSYSGLDWEEFTEKQLKKWGLQYDELIFGKPHGDVYVDDVAISPEEFLRKV